MPLLDGGLLFLAAVAAGALNAVVGAGTLITFPTLLALGVPPVIANVSNTVGLVPGSAAAAYGFRHTLAGRGRVLGRLVGASTVGGVTGGALLLVLPARSFELIVPVLLLGAGALAAVQPRVAAWVAARRAVNGTVARTDGSPLLVLGVAAAGVYGGYFGAAQGVILLGLLGVALGGPMNDLNGIKNVLAGLANLVSAVLFVLVADVDWAVAAVVAAGAIVGGGLGGRYGRRLPSRALRALVVVVAVVAAAWQLVR